MRLCDREVPEVGGVAAHYPGKLAGGPPKKRAEAEHEVDIELDCEIGGEMKSDD